MGNHSKLFEDENKTTFLHGRNVKKTKTNNIGPHLSISKSYS